jgi:hypothetical protein
MGIKKVSFRPTYDRHGRPPRRWLFRFLRILISCHFFLAVLALPDMCDDFPLSFVSSRHLENAHCIGNCIDWLELSLESKCFGPSFPKYTNGFLYYSCLKVYLCTRSVKDSYARDLITHGQWMNNIVSDFPMPREQCLNFCWVKRSLQSVLSFGD